MPGQEEQQQQEGASGGNGAPANQEPTRGQALGTSTRTPVFPGAPGTQQDTNTQSQSAATGQPAPKGRGPVSTSQIPDDALKSRLDRARAQGQDGVFRLLGVKTEAEAKAKLDSLTKAGTEAEQRRLAELSEVERLKAEGVAKDRRIAELEAQLAEHNERHEHEQHDQVITRVAGEVLTPKAMRLYKLDLAQHVKKLHATNPELAEKFGERGIRRFTDKWIKDNPEFAKATTEAAPAAAPIVPAAKTGVRPAAAPAARQGQPLPVRRPVSNGAPARQGQPLPAASGAGGAPGMLNGKTVRPGQPNSMTSAEVKAFAARRGIGYQPI
jgi:hypothetical protein